MCVNAKMDNKRIEDKLDVTKEKKKEIAWRCSAMTVSMRASHSFNSRSRASALAASRA